MIWFFSSMWCFYHAKIFTGVDSQFHTDSLLCEMFGIFHGLYRKSGIDLLRKRWILLVVDMWGLVESRNPTCVFFYQRVKTALAHVWSLTRRAVSLVLMVKFDRPPSSIYVEENSQEKKSTQKRVLKKYQSAKDHRPHSVLLGLWWSLGAYIIEEGCKGEMGMIIDGYSLL